MANSKKDALYDEILDRLLCARYRFGERILVKEVAAETGASRQPTMAALNALCADGFVRIIPQVGCEVVNPTVQEIGDFYKMFARLEGLMAELAAERGTLLQLRALKDANHLIRADFNEHGGSHYRDLNRSFHTILHRMANSPLLDSRQSSVFAMSDFFIVQTVGFVPHVSDASDEHDEIIAALEAKDPKAARIAMEAHIQQSAEPILRRALPGTS